MQQEYVLISEQDMNTCNFYHLTSTNNKPVCMIDISSISPFSQGSWQAGLDILRLAHPT